MVDDVLPAPVAFALLLIPTAVLMARLSVLKSTRADRLLNVSVLLLTCVAASRDPIVQSSLARASGGLLTPAELGQLSEATIMLSSAAFASLGLAWLNKPLSHRSLLGLWLMALGSTALVYLLIQACDPRGAAARGLHSGWAIVAYSGKPAVAIAAVVAHGALSVVFCVMLLVVAARELMGRPNGVGLLACFSVAALAAAWLVQTLLVSAVALLATSSHVANLDTFAMLNSHWPILDAVGFATLAATPLVLRAFDRTGMAIVLTRLHRQLGQMWTELVATCPEVVHSNPSHRTLSDPRARLHIRVVEIRDALRTLSRYIADEDRAYAQLQSDSPSMQYAICLRLASRTKDQGGQIHSSADIPPSTAAGLVDDARELARLARAWREANTLLAAAPPSCAISCD